MSSSTANRKKHPRVSGEIKTITPSARSLLEEITKEAREITEVTTETIHRMPVPNAHRSFKYFQYDMASVLAEIGSGPNEQFRFPVHGGENFLRHMLKCRWCLSSTSFYLASLKNPKLIATVMGLAQASGMKVMDSSARTFEEAVSFPKPS